MRTFKRFNSVGEPCPVCNTRDDKETVLVALAGTQEDGNAEARQVHLECIELWFGVAKDGTKVFYQFV
jgi:hypothetical protein